MSNARRDGNFKPTILGVSSVDFITPTTIAVDPDTGAMLVSGGGITPPNLGGTGIANNAASTLTISGNFGTTLVVSGTTSLTLPNGTDTVAVLGTAQTYTATQTEKQVVWTNNAIAATSNAATVPITSRLSTVTNNSAATLTITMTTTNAVDGQLAIVRVLDASAAAQTITWINTENSSVSVPTTSNGSTTLFLTVGFMYNGGSGKWRCLAVA